MRKIFGWILVLVAVTVLAACSPVTAEQYNAQATQVSELKNQQATQNALLEKLVADPTLGPTTAPTEEVAMEQVETPEPTSTIAPTITPVQYTIPLSWFASQGMVYSDGVTVAYGCEVGARAWQGNIPFNTVLTDSKIELVEVNCVQYLPGETIPQEKLDAMKGQGTIWFLLPIEGTESQKGDCSCLGEDC